MGQLDGNVTLITGGGSGLGRAIVERFIDEGARVGVLELSPAKATQLDRDFGGKVAVTVGDVRSSDDNATAVAETMSAYGKLDTFIGNAGLWDFATALTDLPLEAVGDAFDELFSVNVKGYLLGARASIDALESSQGSMIFTLSNAAFFAGGGGPLYVASKHAVVGIVDQLAYELDGRVRVNGVAPGILDTDLRGPASLGQAETSISVMLDGIGGAPAFAEVTGKPFFPTAKDYVNAYVMLASPESRTTNGAVMQVHGMLGPPPRAGQ